VSVAHGPFDGLNEVPRRLEAESDRIADVQISDSRALSFHPPGFADDVPDGIRKLFDA
jgi:hypothetical protein